MSTDISVASLTAPRTSSATDNALGISKDKTQLDNEGFLKLLLEQMRNQDPSSPMDSATILTQTTQLAQIQTAQEQIATARESFALQMRETAAGFVGRQASWTDATGTVRSGVVTSVDYSNVVPMLRVGDTDVALDAIQTLAVASAAATTTDPTTTD